MQPEQGSLLGQALIWKIVVGNHNTTLSIVNTLITELSLANPFIFVDPAIKHS